MANLEKVIYCDKHQTDRHFFRALKPEVVDTQKAFENAFSRSTSKTLWLSAHIDEFFSFLVKMAMAKPPQISQARLPILLTLEKIREDQSLLVPWLFRRVIEAERGSFLPKDQLAEVLASKNASDLVIGGKIDLKAKVLTLVRGDLSMPLLIIPFSAFKETADSIKPNFRNFEITDYGQTVRLGKYEATLASLLYEFDPEFRRRRIRELAASEKSFGASLRRLRTQKNLTQADFPRITEKEIGRIERGEVKKPHRHTIDRLAKILDVGSDEIMTY